MNMNNLKTLVSRYYYTAMKRKGTGMKGD